MVNVDGEEVSVSQSKETKRYKVLFDGSCGI